MKTKTETNLDPRQKQPEDYAVIKGMDYDAEIRKGNIVSEKDSHEPLPKGDSIEKHRL